MKTKIVYVLVSQETDYYYEMLLLSLYSLRLYHPKETVEVVMDEDTHKRLVDKKAEMLNDVTPIVVPIPPEYTVMQRSRYLKTQLRQLVKGDFLFLDTDTIIYSSLNECDTMDGSICMVSDLNGKLVNRNNADYFLCRKAGFMECEGHPYFNSGVILARDTLKVYQLFENWHQLWLLSLQNGVPQDQPALCQANMQSGFQIKELPAVWNSMKTSEDYFRKIKIRHYFNRRRSIMRTMIFEHIKNTGSVEDFSNMIRNPYTICESALIISDERVAEYLSSEMFYFYETSPKLFSFLSRIDHLTAKFYIWSFNLRKAFR